MDRTLALGELDVGGVRWCSRVWPAAWGRCGWPHPGNVSGRDCCGLP